MRTTLFILLLSATDFSFGQSLPEFSFDNTAAIPARVDQSLLGKDSAVIVIYFDAHNQDCIDQAREISDNMDKVKHITFLWVCANEQVVALTFKTLNFAHQENIIVAIDTESKFEELFGSIDIPTVICYNAQWEKVHTLSKFQKAENLAFGVE